MTQNQISFAVARENARHNKASEELTQKLNKETAKHYKRQDAINKEHYERSDTAGMISANASAANAEASRTNAQTNRLNYNMQYDIEYGWTGNTGWPAGMPLSAQKKNYELEYATLYGDAPATVLERERRELENKAIVANNIKNVANAYTSILNSVFGKGGVVAAVKSD